MRTWTMQMMLKRWSGPEEKSCFTLNHYSGKIDESKYRILRPVKLQTQSSQFGYPLQKTFNAETSLIKGGGGDFDVYVDNVLIFSKKKEGRFPNEGEVERLIKNQSWSGFLS